MTKHTKWTQFLNLYTDQNAGRRTRLGVFELNRSVVNDYWLEDGLPLVGIDVEAGKDAQKVLVSVGDMTHEIDDVIKLTVHFTSSGYEDGLDILDRQNRVTILRFEKAA